MKPPGWAVALFAASLTLRVAYVIVQNRWAVFGVPVSASDGVAYRWLADSLVSGEGFAIDGRPTAYVTPGYPAFLALVFLFGDSSLTVGLAQAVLGALTTVLLALAARCAAGPVAGLATGAIALVYPGLIFWTPVDLTETTYIFAVALSAWLLARALEDPAPKRGLAAGLAAGFAGLVRPPLLGAAIVLGLAGLVTRLHRRAAIFALIGSVSVAGVWVVRNALVVEAPTLSTESGIVLYQGNSPKATGGTRGYVDGADFEPLVVSPSMTEAEVDRTYRSAALGWMRANPEKVLALVPKKLWNMFRPSYAGASDLNIAVTLATYIPLLVFAAIGFFRRWSVPLVRALAIVVVYHLALHGLATGMIRFRPPIEALLTIPAGLAVAGLWQRWRGRATEPA